MTHEYLAGCEIVARYLGRQPGIEPVVIKADNPWSEGPALLDGADAVFLYLTEGAKWVSDNADRLAAFQRLAKRGGGLSCLHWGMGTREATPIAGFVPLFGGCHGGPDRRYKVGEFQLAMASRPHEILSGLVPFSIRDELYYDLKFPRSPGSHVPLLQARIEDVDYPVAWAWERPDQGRSFGFTGLHFHHNWNQLEYRRLVVQGILWTLGVTIPKAGLDLELTEADLVLPDPSAK